MTAIDQTALLFKLFSINFKPLNDNQLGETPVHSNTIIKSKWQLLKIGSRKKQQSQRRK